MCQGCGGFAPGVGVDEVLVVLAIELRIPTLAPGAILLAQFKGGEGIVVKGGGGGAWGGSGEIREENIVSGSSWPINSTWAIETGAAVAVGGMRRRHTPTTESSPDHAKETQDDEGEASDATMHRTAPRSAGVVSSGETLSRRGTESSAPDLRGSNNCTEPSTHPTASSGYDVCISAFAAPSSIVSSASDVLASEPREVGAIVGESIQARAVTGDRHWSAAEGIPGALMSHKRQQLSGEPLPEART